MAKKIITALSAGLTLAVASGCGSKTDGPTENPPPPEPVKVEPVPNPPPVSTLPTWDEAVNPTPKDGIPEIQTTNPPVPSLRTDAEGRCYVTWTDPRREPPTGPYDPATEGGTEIQCPPEKAE